MLKNQISQYKYKNVVIFLPRKVQTGGERFLIEVYTHLRGKKILVKPIYINNSVEKRWDKYLVLNCLLDNFYYYRQAKQIDNLSNTIFFEDFHLHPRLWLFNIFIRFTTGKLKTVVLIQSELFYHNVLKRSYLKYIDFWIVRVFFKQANLILTNSKFSRKGVLSLGVDPGKVKVIYCGYTALPVKELNINKITEKNIKNKRILYVGQCADFKGIKYLIKAIPMFSNNQVVLDIVGNTAAEPEYFSQLKSIIKELKLQDRVTFHDHVSNKKALAKFFNFADVFVLPSLVEGFGIVLLDAMSFGLPIVATSVGAIPELVEDGVNGLLVPPAKPEALAKSIEDLLDSSTLRKKYGKAGYNFIYKNREFYTWEAVVDRALNMMEPILKETK